MLSTLIVFILSLNVAYSFSKANVVNSCKEISKGTCTEIAGRIRLYNNKHVRIWRKGTKRMYQVVNQSESAFFDLKHLNMATEIHADLDLCFLKSEDQPGYAEVCIQSVKNIKTAQRPE